MNISVVVVEQHEVCERPPNVDSHAVCHVNPSDQSNLFIISLWLRDECQPH
jgi:hypothetical protein